MLPSTVVPMSSLSREDLLAASLGGALAFPVALGLGQLAVFKPLRITCSSPLASVCGGVSVLAAGCVASATALQALSLSHHWKNSRQSVKPDSSELTVEFGVQELLASTVASAILFRALGGRFSSVLPSHLLKPGAFAREWIPVRATQSTERQRHIIRELGKSHGCHSCGTRGVKQFHADHQPPNKLHSGQKEVTQRLYPQCMKCSSLQGSLLSHSNGPLSKWSAIRTHSLSLRGYHVFLPIPLAIAYLKSGSSNPVSVKQVNVSSVKTSNKCVQVSTTPDPRKSSALESLFGEANLPSLIRDFPLLIVWNRIVYFLDSFRNPGDAFHITLLAFAVIAALGTI